MEHTVFITDIDTPLGASLARLYLTEGFSVFGTGTTEKGLARISEEMTADREGAFVAELWRRASPISARNMMLKAQNTLGEMNDFIVLGNPVSLPSGFHDLKVDVLDRDIDEWVKGNLFLLRDILVHCMDREQSNVSLVCLIHEISDSPLSDTIRRSFLGLAHALLGVYGGGAFNIQAFESAADLTEEFALYIFRTLTERSGRAAGKWMRYQKGLFSTLKKTVD